MSCPTRLVPLLLHPLGRQLEGAARPPRLVQLLIILLDLRRDSTQSRRSAQSRRSRRSECARLSGALMVAARAGHTQLVGRLGLAAQPRAPDPVHQPRPPPGFGTWTCAGSCNAPNAEEVVGRWRYKPTWGYLLPAPLTAFPTALQSSPASRTLRTILTPSPLTT